MPYIDDENKRETLSSMSVVANEKINSDGELNYFLCRLLSEYLLEEGIRYDNMKRIMGVLDNVKDEFYRRVISVYEDEKCEQNGDVFNDLLEVIEEENK